MWEGLWQAAALLAIGVIVIVWNDSLRAREHALAEGKRACERHGLQFLDQSVECVSLWPARNGAGRLVLRRVYRFEFSDNGNNRRSGYIVMLGDEEQSLTMEPFLLK